MIKTQWTDIVEDVKDNFDCRVYSCEGQPCLEFRTYETLGKIIEYLRSKRNTDVLDVFYMSTQN